MTQQASQQPYPGEPQGPRGPLITRALIAVALGAVALVGCGGEPAPDAQAVETTATPTATPTPTGMSVQQVASNVATIQATNEKLVKDLEKFCDITKWSDSLVDAQALACSYVIQRAPLEGQVAVKTLTIANPPAEVAALLVATRNSASALGKLSSKQCEKSPTSDGCTMVERFKANEAAENFQLAFAGWEPYL